MHVEGRELKEGDKIEIGLADDCMSQIKRDCTHKDALARLQAMAWVPPPEFSFSRDEANQRGG